MTKRKIAAFLAAALMAVTPVYSGAKSAVPSFNAVQASAAEYEKTTEGFVKRMYQVILNRTPDQTGLQNWVDRLNNHTLTASDIIYGFFCSDEYKGKNKSKDEIIADCYKAMLDRSPDASGKASWMARLDIGMTSMAICKGFVGSNEFKGLCEEYGIETGSIPINNARDENYERTYFVYRLYANCLGRTPDITGLENWCRNLKNGTTGTQIAKGFIFSKEYSGRNTSNKNFVTMLYGTILGRAADSNGLSTWTGNLNAGKSRESVLNGFLFSNEFKGQCAKAGIVLGDKLHTPEDDNPYMAYATEVVNIVNNERRAAGLKELEVLPALQAAAYTRAYEISGSKSFGHIRPNGKEFHTVYGDYNLDYTAAGENIAAYYSTPAGVMNGWMNSEGHKENILNVRYKYIGIGIYKSGGTYFWVQLFML